MTLEQIIVGPMQVNCYILASAPTNQAIVIDPGAEPEKIKLKLDRLGCQLSYIVNTHGHADHIGANSALKVPVYIHRLDADFLTRPELNLSAMLQLPITAPLPVQLLEDGQRLQVEDISLEIIHTPGHTPGSICLHAGDFLFTGDTLFASGVGRTDIPRASQEELLNSIRNRLFSLPDKLIIYPGHGPSSTIGKERRNNPF